MNRLVVNAFVGLALLGCHLVSHAERYALVPDQVIDGVQETAQGDIAVLVEDARIVGLVAKGDIPADYEHVDLQGMTLMPGMINAHEHPLLYDDNYQTAHLTASSAYKALLGLAAMQRWLAHGWTTIRVMGDGDVFYGNQDLQRVFSEGVFVGPRITGAAHYISITGGGGDINYGSPLLVTGAFHSVGDDPRNVAFSPDELAEAVAEAARHNVPVAAHAHATDGINQAIRAGVRSIEHGTYLNDESIRLMVEHGTFYVPTIYVGDYYAGTDKLLAQEKNDDAYLSYRDEWLAKIGRAHAAGVKVVVGVDLGGYNIEPEAYAREFAALIEAGLSPMAAIQAGTSVSADLLQWSDRVGRIQSGLFADLIAVPGNPLEDISVLEAPSFVMMSGKVVKPVQ